MTRTVLASARLVPPKPFIRQIVLSFMGTDCRDEVVLSAGEAAILMSEIGQALDEADRRSRGASSDARLSLKFPSPPKDV